MERYGSAESRSQFVVTASVILVIVAAGIVLVTSVLFAARDIDRDAFRRQQIVSMHSLAIVAGSVGRDVREIATKKGLFERIVASRNLSEVTRKLFRKTSTGRNFRAIFVTDEAGRRLDLMGDDDALAASKAWAVAASIPWALRSLEQLKLGETSDRMSFRTKTDTGVYRHVGQVVMWKGRPAIIHTATILPSSGTIGPERAFLLTTVLEITNAMLTDAGLDLGLINLRWAPKGPVQDDMGQPIVSHSDTLVGTLTWNSDRPGKMLIKKSWLGMISAFSLFAWFGTAAIIGSRRYIRQLAREKARAEFLADHDQLTGLANRRVFNQRLDEMFARLGKEGSISFLSIDLDHFKQLNDTLGHDAGDQALQIVAQRMLSSSPKDALVSRLGGDEFVILVENVSAQDIMGLGERVIEAIAQPFELSGAKTANLGASIGVAHAPCDAANAEELKRRADIALYEIKQTGRSYCLAFDPAMAAKAVSRMVSEQIPQRLKLTRTS